MATLYISSIGQKSADYGNDFEFSTTKDDGNKKFIKYTAVSLGYSQWNTDVDELTKFTTQKNQAFHFVWEGYNTFSKKLAGSTQAKISYLKNKDFMIGVDYGIYLIIFKGLYLKASIGYGSLFNKATDGSPYIFTYGGEGGYLFKIKSGEGKRPFYIALFGGYQGYSGNEYDSYTDYTNTFSGRGPGGGLKFMWGPKPVTSSN